MKKTIDPFWWALFSAGGVLSAIFVPLLLFLTGIAFPLGWLDAPAYDHLAGLVRNPISRLFLFALISLSLFHWAHRFRFTLYDGLQLNHLHELIAVICYGGALVVTAIAAWTLWNF